MTNQKKKSGRQISRRRFFKRFLTEAAISVAEKEGGQQMLISDISGLPDPVILKMEPVVQETNNFCIYNDALWETPPAPEPDIEVTRFTRVQQFIIALFDGCNTIESISNRTAEKFQLDQAGAREEVVTFFMYLTQFAVCFPARPNDAYESGEN